MSQLFLDVSDATPSDLFGFLFVIIGSFIIFPFLVILFFKLLDKMNKKKTPED
jgi:hypothetical protein